MSIADATLRMVLLGDDVSASAALRRVGDNATATQKRLATMSAGMAKFGKTMTHAFTLPAIAIAAGSAKMATDFSTAMTRIQTQAGGSAKDVQELSKQVLALSASHAQQGPVDLANSLYHLKSVGLDNVQAMKALRQASDLAAVGNTSLEDTTNALAGAWRTGIKGATNFHDAVKTLNAIVGAGNMSMADLNSALSTGILPAAKTFGLKLKDVGSALALFTDEGQGADMAATRLRMTFALLGAPSQAAEKVLSGIGLSGHQLGEELRKPNGLIRTIALLKDHLEGLNKYYPNPGEAAAYVAQHTAEATKLLSEKPGSLTRGQRAFITQYGQAKNGLILNRARLDPAEQAAVLSRAFGGGRSGATIMSLVNNLDVLEKKQKQVTAGMAKFGADAKKQAQTPQAQFKRLIAVLETLGVEIGNKLLPGLVKAADGVNHFVTWFSKLSPTVQKATAGFAVLLALLGPGALLMAKFINAYLLIGKVFAAVRDSTLLLRVQLAALWVQERLVALWSKIVAAAQWLLNAAMDANPIGLVVLALAALVVGFIYAYKHSATFRAIVQASLHGVEAAARAVMGFFEHGIPAAFHAIVSAGESVLSWARSHWVLIASIIGGPVVAVALQVIKHFGEIKAAVVSSVGTVVTFVRSIPGKILAAIGNLGHLLWNAGEAAIQGLISGIESKVGSLTSALHHITSLIPLHKGPIEKDRMLLFPAGQAIIDGLINGVKSKRLPLQTLLTDLTNMVKAAGQKLQGTIQARNQFAGGFQGFTSSLFGMTLPTDANGNTIAPTAQSILAYQKAQEKQAAQVNRDVHKLVAKGLSPALIRQMESQGAAGIQEIQALAGASTFTIHRLNRLNARTTGDLHRAGMDAANHLYGKQIAQEQKHYNLVEKLLTEIRDDTKDQKRKDLVAKIDGSQLVLMLIAHQRKHGGAALPIKTKH